MQFALEWAHPRSRGEHVTSPAPFPGFSGSSPLARGTHGSARVPRRYLRLIPARAGNTNGRRCGGGIPPAHPRSRGEHRNVVLVGGRFQGSSPLARGTRAMFEARKSIAGLIPARAGNTKASHHIRDRNSAHPRSRGEHVVDLRCAGALKGSSPLARGTPTLRLRGLHIARLIPARAGNTLADKARYPSKA